MSRYNTLIKKLKEFCESMNCDLVIQHYSKYDVCFKAVPSDDDNNELPFAISIYYPRHRKYSKDENGNRITIDTIDTTRNATFDICSCHDEYSGGQFKKEQIQLLLAIDGLTDEELCIETPHKECEEDGN